MENAFSTAGQPTRHAGREAEPRPAERRGAPAFMESDAHGIRPLEVVEDTEFTGRVIGQYQTD